MERSSAMFNIPFMLSICEDCQVLPFMCFPGGGVRSGW